MSYKIINLFNHWARINYGRTIKGASYMYTKRHYMSFSRTLSYGDLSKQIGFKIVLVKKKIIRNKYKK